MRPTPNDPPIPPEAPAPDVVEQRQPVDDEAEADQLPAEMPHESDPVDAADQRIPVPLDEDHDR